MGGVGDRNVRGKCGGGVEQVVERRVPPGSSALLDQPPAGDIAHEANSTRCRLLVREPGVLRRAGGVGCGRSRPTRSQVPLDTKASPDRPPPATADAVSWPATRCTGTPRHVPARVPGSWRGARSDGSTSMASSSSWDQVAVDRSSSPVVPALVRSARCSPVRWCTSSSGSRRMRAVRSSAVRSWAASWKIVLYLSGGSPVIS